MSNNRSIKKIIKKKISIINNKEHYIRNTSKTDSKIVKKDNTHNKKNVNKKISTPILKVSDNKIVENNKKPTIKIIDKNAKNNSVTLPKNLSRFDKKNFERTGKLPAKAKKVKPPIYFTYPPYEKEENIDFNVGICISSYNRFSKVNRLLEQIYQQNSKYKFKVFLMNDGSSGTLYSRFKKLYPELIYMENEVNGGKVNYWKTLHQLWSSVDEYKTHALCQMDDDFLLCDNFIDILMDEFYNQKEIDNGIMGFKYHIGYFKHIGKFVKSEQSLDGGSLFDIQFMKMIDYSVGETFLEGQHDSSRVWFNMNELLRENGIKVYYFENSLAFHDGNEDSKLNPLVRKKYNIITKDFLE